MDTLRRAPLVLMPVTDSSFSRNDLGFFSVAFSMQPRPQSAACSLQLCFASMASRGLVIPHFRPTGPQPFRCRFERRAVSGPYSRRPGHVTTHHFSENHSFTLLFHFCSRVYRAGTQQYRHIVGWGMYVSGRIKGRVGGDVKKPAEFISLFLSPTTDIDASHRSFQVRGESALISSS
jgi:hypothetical protein